MIAQLFFEQVAEYISRLKKNQIIIEFAITLKVNGLNLMWPDDSSPASPVDRSQFTGRRPLYWEGKKTGDFYWNGLLDKHLQTVNTLLLENLVTKIILTAQARSSLNCGMGVLDSAIRALEAKDHYTRGHSDRVAALAVTLADILNADFPKSDIEIAAKLHDIGKIGISEQILCKPGILSKDEFAQIQKHPDIGANILSPLPVFQHLVPAIRHHHEKYDGTGYPEMIRGTDIPMLSRIIAVADTFDALTSNRSYRRAMTIQQASIIITNAKYTQLDPSVVNTFLTIPENVLSSIIAA